MLQGTALRRVATAATAACLLLATAVPAGADDSLIAEGFAGPLGLAIGDDGTFYVAELFGGQLTTIDKRGNRATLVQGGVAGVDARGKGNVVYTETVIPEEGGALDTRVIRTNPTGMTIRSTSLQAYEEAVNPDSGNTYGPAAGTSQPCLAVLPDWFSEAYQGVVESNPYAVAISGGDVMVADAAGNALLRVGANGRVSTAAVLPPVPITLTAEHVAARIALDELFGEDPLDLSDCIGETIFAEPVPTDIEIGPDGHWYVSSLPGTPELPGTGSVFRVNSRTGAVSTVTSGLTFAVDLAVGSDGTIYVAELVGGGDSLGFGSIAVIRGGAISDRIGAFLPGAVEIGRDGALYATTRTFAGGALERIVP